MFNIHTFTITLIVHGVLSSRETSFQLSSIENAPYLALVLCNNSKYFCTGTVVHERWVLTSAHCLYGTRGMISEDDNSVFVVAGTDSLVNAETAIKNGAAQIRKSKKLIVHDDYRFTDNFVADLALVQLQEPFNMTMTTKVVPEHDNYGYVKTTQSTSLLSCVCNVFGFGKVFLNDEDRDDGSLKQQTFTVSKKCKCLRRAQILRYHMTAWSTNAFLCGEVSDDFTGLCSGDQGAPLMCNNFLRGIGTAAFHYSNRRSCSYKVQPNECGSPQTMYVFTDLCFYGQWMSSKVPQYPPVDESCNPYG